MDLIAQFTWHLYSEISPLLVWAVSNWATTLVFLAMVIYLTGRNRRTRHHL